MSIDYTFTFDGVPVRYTCGYSFKWDGKHLSTAHDEKFDFTPLYSREELGETNFKRLRDLPYYFGVPFDEIRNDMLELVIDLRYQIEQFGSKIY